MKGKLNRSFFQKHLTQQHFQLSHTSTLSKVQLPHACRGVNAATPSQFMGHGPPNTRPTGGAVLFRRVSAVVVEEPWLFPHSHTGGDPRGLCKEDASTQGDDLETRTAPRI